MVLAPPGRYHSAWGAGGWWVAGSRSGSMTTIPTRGAVARMSSPAHQCAAAVGAMHHACHND
eukprot:scaffold62727_cov62-Phaeocystis_antarctica.AAC.4